MKVISTPISPVVIEEYNRLSEAEKNFALKLATRNDIRKNVVRVRSYLPQELFVVLAHYGAFRKGMTDLFVRLATREFEIQIASLRSAVFDPNWKDQIKPSKGEEKKP